MGPLRLVQGLRRVRHLDPWQALLLIQNHREADLQELPREEDQLYLAIIAADPRTFGGPQSLGKAAPVNGQGEPSAD